MAAPDVSPPQGQPTFRCNSLPSGTIIGMQRGTLIGFVVGAVVATAATGAATRAMVSGSDIRDGSITARDLSPALRKAMTGAQGAQGATGPQGVQGPKGDAGQTGAQGPRGDAATSPSVAWVRVNWNGGSWATGYQGQGVIDVSGGGGSYTVTFDRPVAGCAITLGGIYTNISAVSDSEANPALALTPNQVSVSAPSAHFSLVLTCP